ncbi:MAG TPA: CBS domain-containing protein [Trebonia sp.]|jgi:CBS domain-containing protein
MAAQLVSDVMTAAPVTVPSGQSLTQTAKAMRDHDIGDVLVIDNGRLAGLVTDRDIVVRGLADGGDPGQTTVGEICSADLVTVAPDDEADTAVQRMREQAVRRVPVVDGQQIVGVLSLGDMAMERDERSALADVSVQAPNT